jgi:YidC/Oxa1 family membrane protein insertase
MRPRIIRFLFFTLLFLLIFQLFGGRQQQDTHQDDIVLSAKSKMTIGKLVQVQIANHTEIPLVIPSSCPKNPLTVESYQNGEWLLKEAKLEKGQCNPADNVTIEAGATAAIAYDAWNHKIFDREGRYRISLNTTVNAKEKVFFIELSIVSPGLFRTAWNTLFYKPIFNGLLYLISVVPGHSLGWGVVLLTLLIKLLVLGPNQKALRAQKQMQKIQPQLDALKIKYKNNQQRLAQETMAIWKKYKVSPMSSCLPMLIQFPILIALFYVVRDGLAVTDPHLFYESLKGFDPAMINPHFFGLNLTKKNIIVLPLVVGGMQFLQMRLAFGKQKTKGKKEVNNPLAGMGKTMQYVMPLMIAFFTATLPAAVGFYWGTSTLFGIGQQMVVNRMKD